MISMNKEIKEDIKSWNNCKRTQTDEWNKGSNNKIEILEKNQTEILKMKISINQIKSSGESFMNRIQYGEDRITELEDKVYELEHAVRTRRN